MRRFLRGAGIGTLLIVTMTLLAGIVVLFGASRQFVLAHGVQDFERATGLDVRLGETFEPVFWPIPGWQLGKIEISDPTSGTSFLTAQHSRLTIAPLGLLNGTLNIGALWLDEVSIQVPAPERLLATPPNRTPRVPFLRLRDAEITVGDVENADNQTLTLDFASLDFAGSNNPMDLTFSGMWRSRSINGALQLTSLDRAARGDWVFADAEITIDDDRFQFQGRFMPKLISEFPIIAGNIEANIANPAGAMSWLTRRPADETLINLKNVTLEGRAETLPERLLLRSRWVGDYIDTRMTLDATLRAEAGWQTSGVGSVNAVARAGGLFSSHLNGSFARDQGVSGDLSLSVLDLPGTFDAGMVPDAYRLSNARNGSVKGRLSATTQGFALADATLLLGPERYSGDVAIDLRGERPFISLGTGFETFELDRWLDPILNGRQALAGLLPKIDPDLEFEVTAETVRYRDLTAGPMTVSIATRPEAIEIDIRQLDVANGILAGNASIAKNSSIAHLELTAAEIDTSVLLQQFDLTGISGIAGGQLSAELPFPPLKPWWENVQSSGMLSMYGTRLDGIDLRGGTSGAGAVTALSQLDLEFALQDGALTVDQLTFRDTFGEGGGSGGLLLPDRAIEGEISFTEGNESLTIEGLLHAPIVTRSTPDPLVVEDFPVSESDLRDREAITSSPTSPTQEPATIGPSEPAQQGEEELGTSDIVPASEVTQPEALPAGFSETESQIAAVTDVAKPAEPETNAEATAPETAPLPQRPRR